MSCTLAVAYSWAHDPLPFLLFLSPVSCSRSLPRGTHRLQDWEGAWDDDVDDTGQVAMPLARITQSTPSLSPRVVLLALVVNRQIRGASGMGAPLQAAGGGGQRNQAPRHRMEDQRLRRCVPPDHYVAPTCVGNGEGYGEVPPRSESLKEYLMHLSP